MRKNIEYILKIKCAKLIEDEREKIRVIDQNKRFVSLACGNSQDKIETKFNLLNEKRL